MYANGVPMDEAQLQAAFAAYHAVFTDSHVTRVALPAIVGGIGTIALAVVTVRLSINDRAHQDQLRRADELARRVEADRQQAIKVAEERAASSCCYSSRAT